MKINSVAKWFLAPEKIQELETDYETFSEFILHKLIDKTSEQVSGMDYIINHIAYLMFDPKDSD